MSAIETNQARQRNSAGTLHTLGHYIAGKVLDGGRLADDARFADVYDPVAGEASKQVCLADTDILEQAIQAAETAFLGWRKTPPQKRARILFKFKSLLEEHSDGICHLITAEHGKVLDDARGELARGIEVVEYACGISELLKGEHSKNAGPGIDTWSEFQALGVVVGITPFNFPAMVPMWMFPMAIACGNTFILKPSERTPSAAMFIAELFTRAGLPAGVFNVVNGDKDTVQGLIDDNRIQAISFVGSTPVAESIFQRASNRGKRVQALGGAKNHAVVMPDADIDQSVSALMGAAYGSCGERCMAISVAVCVGEDTSEKVVSCLEPKVRNLKIGPGTDTGNDMGPLITRTSLERVRSYIEQGQDQGAGLVVDGREISVSGHEQGFFIGGTLFDKVTESMGIYTDEIFGPVLCVVTVNNLDEAIGLINRHEYGNGTCIFTRDGESASYFSDNVQIGMVGVNVALPVPVASQSFGGWKRSLFGDLYVYGPDAVRFYTRRKTLTQRWPASTMDEGPRYSFPSN